MTANPRPAPKLSVPDAMELATDADIIAVLRKAAMNADIPAEETLSWCVADHIAALAAERETLRGKNGVLARHIGDLEAERDGLAEWKGSVQSLVPDICSFLCDLCNDIRGETLPEAKRLADQLTALAADAGDAGGGA